MHGSILMKETGTKIVLYGKASHQMDDATHRRVGDSTMVVICSFCETSCWVVGGVVEGLLVMRGWIGLWWR